MLKRGILYILTIQWPLMGSVKCLRKSRQLHFKWNVTQQETFTHCHPGMCFNVRPVDMSSNLNQLQ